MVAKRFDPENYEIEPEIKFKNDVSIKVLTNFVKNGMPQTNICPVDNIVRWRYGPKGG
jgi:hypothetical protein